jgi:hypothetical protein
MNDISVLKKFRQILYELMPKRRDATMDLIDALSTHHQANSVTQLSLSPFFRRKYASITKVIKHFLYRDFDFDKNGKLQLILAPCKKSQKKLQQLLASLCEASLTRNFFYL